jgi:hypothetical protein
MPSNGRVYICSNLGGTPSVLLEIGRIIGQVADGMLITDMTNDDVVIRDLGPWVTTRYVGSSGTPVTGLPPEHIGIDRESVITDLFTCETVACKVTTAILLAREILSPETPTTQIIYRSTDTGRSFTEVHRWTEDVLINKFGKVEIGYSGDTDGIWWVGGASSDANLGVWRSEDDGLTWTFISSPPDHAINSTPVIISAGRGDVRER